MSDIYLFWLYSHKSPFIKQNLPVHCQHLITLILNQHTTSTLQTTQKFFQRTQMYPATQHIQKICWGQQTGNRLSFLLTQRYTKFKKLSSQTDIHNIQQQISSTQLQSKIQIINNQKITDNFYTNNYQFKNIFKINAYVIEISLTFCYYYHCQYYFFKIIMKQQKTLISALQIKMMCHELLIIKLPLKKIPSTFQLQLLLLLLLSVHITFKKQFDFARHTQTYQTRQKQLLQIFP
eukprot:TRINITY_DN13657_c0_g3_i1.p1 TRINITY_DN13657_c0_g3~~TRINITY_DN13657_c0_g3_i1.p1  ORF type:complete len:235 (-),score=-23.65 TRINITY_DN13657_c0_g3_i1:303-1007(-)